MKLEKQIGIGLIILGITTIGFMSALTTYQNVKTHSNTEEIIINKFQTIDINIFERPMCNSKDNTSLLASPYILTGIKTPILICNVIRGDDYTLIFESVGNGILFQEKIKFNYINNNQIFLDLDLYIDFNATFELNLYKRNLIGNGGTTTDLMRVGMVFIYFK